MNTLRLPLATSFATPWLLLCALTLSGCDSDAEEITATASESGETSSTSGTGETSPTSSTTTADNSASETATSTSGPDTNTSESSGTADTDTADTDGTDTSEFNACEDAQTADDCQNLEFYDCEWFGTTTVALDNKNACGDLGFDDEGVCVAIGQADSGCPVDFIPTCPDGTTVFYRELGLEVGAVELLSVEQSSVCGPPDGMMECQVNSDPKPGSEPSFFPAECECACDGA